MVCKRFFFVILHHVSACVAPSLLIVCISCLFLFMIVRDRSINDRQIEELNSMLSANVQSQQQNMMQYLQQQQFMQQSFPHQQLNLPYISQPGNPGPAPMSQAMASVNAMAASIMQPNAYNTNGYNTNGGYQVGMQMGQNNQANPNQGGQNSVYRPAPIHLGAPYQAHYNPIPSDPNYYNNSAGGVTLPIIPSAMANPNQAAQSRYPEDRQTEISPTTKEPAPSGGHSKHRDADIQDTTRSRSEDSGDNHHGGAQPSAPSPHRSHPSNDNLTGRSSLGSSHGPADTGRLGTGSLGTPGGHSGAGGKMPANRIVRKGNGGAKLAAHSNDSDDESDYSGGAQPRRRASGDSDNGNGNGSTKGKPGSSSSSSAGGAGGIASGGATSQHAFLANIMNRQAQQGNIHASAYVLFQSLALKLTFLRLFRIFCARRYSEWSHAIQRDDRAAHPTLREPLAFQ
jgi:hypothetical protein